MKTYYKATDKNMQCRGYQFSLGEWSDPVMGDLKLGENGYNFCEHMSGVFAYYDAAETRVFKCEVRDAIISDEPGSSAKSVCRQIRLLEEVEIGSDRNTGHRNTGHLNTGDRNTGDCNAGDRNTGHLNTGDRNTGDCNTGDRNTGHLNTGDRNTGDCNTGNGHSGVFGVGDAPFLSFGEPADRSSFPWGKARRLYEAICTQEEGFDVSPYLSIPNATEERIRTYHRAWLEARTGKGGKQ